MVQDVTDDFRLLVEIVGVQGIDKGEKRELYVVVKYRNIDRRKYHFLPDCFFGHFDVFPGQELRLLGLLLQGGMVKSSLTLWKNRGFGNQRTMIILCLGL
jgi:hypothetical protein